MVKGNRFSLIAVWLLVLVLGWVQLNHALWKEDRGGIAWDVGCYYMYLSALTIHGDLSMGGFDDPSLYQNELQDCLMPNATGGALPKTSMGLAYLYAPAFYLAHLTAPWFGYPQNGYNAYYGAILRLSSLLFIALGLFTLRHLLLNQFSDIITAASLTLVTVGTNLFYYASLEPNMAHLYNFALLAAVMLFTIKWQKKPGYVNTITLGLLLGLAALIRPTNVTFILIPGIYGLSKILSVTTQLNYLWQQRVWIALMIVAFILPWVPQFAYWHHFSGRWLHYSYGHEGFNFLQPHILDGLFSYRKGWLLYTPLMIFALLGLFLNRSAMGKWFWPAAMLLPVYIYVAFSWWCWWYGGSFGQRVMIDIYPLLTFGLGAYLSWLLNKPTIWKSLGIAVLLLLAAYNQFQILQKKKGILTWDSMTREAYWDSFLRLQPTDGYEELLDNPND